MSDFFVFEITSRCNLACLYCYNIWHQNDECIIHEMSFPLFQRTLQKLKKENPDFSTLALAGGEPLLNKDVRKMARFAAGEGLKVIITTNGVLLDEAFISDFLKGGVNHFILSLPALKEEDFAALCRCSGCPERIKKAAILLRRHNANFALAFTLTKMNASAIKDVFNFARLLGVTELQINRFCPGGRGLDHEDKLHISDEEARDFLASLNTMADSKLKVVCNMGFEPCHFDYAGLPNLRFGKCECGLKKWTVDSRGNLRICEQDSTLLGSLLEQSFNDLTAHDYVSRFNSKNLKPECRSCDRFNLCRGGCRYRKL